MDNLLPCPFCGGEAETLTAESIHGGYLFGIMCNDCGSRGDVYDTEAEAVAAWNTRAERTCEEYGSVRVWQTCNIWSHELSCGHETDTLEKEPPNYCPSCGAKVVERMTCVCSLAGTSACASCFYNPNGTRLVNNFTTWNTRAETSYEDVKILLDELGLSERTCTVEGEEFDDLLDATYTKLSCGHYYPGLAEYVNYCPKCGARVVEK